MNIEWENTKFASIDPNVAIEEMKALGYRQTSRKFRIVSRVDIPVSTMKKLFIDENFGDETSSIPSLPIAQQKDHYRRCYSQDSICGVPENIMEYLR